MKDLKEKLESIGMNGNIKKILKLNNTIPDMIDDDRYNNPRKYIQIREFQSFLKLKNINMSLEQLYLLLLTNGLYNNIIVNNLWKYTSNGSLNFLYEIYNAKSKNMNVEV